LNTSPLISVIMPVYNTANYVKKAIESILNQTYPNFEFLIYNDGSTDGSADVIKSIVDSRIVFYDSKHNKGNVYWVNIAIKSAKGIYIARMDSDDIAMPQRFEKQLDILNNLPEVGLCGGWVQPFDEKGKASIWAYPEKDEKIKIDFLFSNPIGNPTVLMRKSIFEKYSLEYDARLFPCEDYYLWYKLYPLIKFYNIPEVLINYRIHSGQSTQIVKESKVISNKINLLFWLQSGLVTDDGLEKVVKFIHNEWQRTESFLRASGAFLISLATINRKLNRFNIVDFEKRIYNLFWLQCYFATGKKCNGLKIYNEFVTDSIYKLSVKKTVKIYLKVLFR
jgi:glycosyltransferase involved in cell wall biosynthesis